MAHHMISVRRQSGSKCRLWYNGTHKWYRCWVDPADKSKVPAGLYHGTATFMGSKKRYGSTQPREGIFIEEFGSRGIFIHEWPLVNLKSWSDGCYLLTREDMLEIWESLPLNRRNSVHVRFHG